MKVLIITEALHLSIYQYPYDISHKTFAAFFLTTAKNLKSRSIRLIHLMAIEQRYLASCICIKCT